MYTTSVGEAHDELSVGGFDAVVIRDLVGSVDSASTFVETLAFIALAREDGFTGPLVGVSDYDQRQLAMCEAGCSDVSASAQQTDVLAVVADAFTQPPT